MVTVMSEHLSHAVRVEVRYNMFRAAGRRWFVVVIPEHGPATEYESNLPAQRQAERIARQARVALHLPPAIPCAPNHSPNPDI